MISLIYQLPLTRWRSSASANRKILRHEYWFAPGAPSNACIVAINMDDSGTDADLKRVVAEFAAVHDIDLHAQLDATYESPQIALSLLAWIAGAHERPDCGTRANFRLWPIAHLSAHDL